jgi:hypothetical protein
MVLKKSKEAEKKKTKQAIKKLNDKAGIKKTLTNKEMKINFMLSQEKKPYKCMAIGEHDGHYYFGNILYYGGKRIPVIILDNGTIYWNNIERTDDGKIIDYEIRDDFGLNYRYELFDEVIENLWSNKSIKSFIAGNEKQLNFKDIFLDIRDKNKELIYHIDTAVHDYIACDIISNYFYPLFEAKGRTYFQADYASGKSRQSMIYQLLSFNSVFASSITAAVFERIIESTGGTIIVDNFDNINDEMKKSILQVIEVYYKKGGKNIKASGYKHKPEMYNGFSPLVINNIIGLPEVTASRCNKIKMLRTTNKKILDKKVNEKDTFWNDLKDKLHILALQKWKEVKKAYDNLEVKELVARDLEIAAPILTIAKLVGDDIYEELLRLLIRVKEQESIKDVKDSWEFILFEYLQKKILEGEEEEQEIRVVDITEGLHYKIVNSERTEKSDKLKFSHYVGKILSSIPIFPKRVSSGYVIYKIRKKDLLNVLQVKGYDKYLQINTPNPQNTPNPLNTPNTTKFNNFNNNNNFTHKNSSVSRVQCVKRVTSELKKNNFKVIKPEDFLKNETK